MSLQIVEVRDKGDLESERLLLKVNEDINLKGIVVMDNTYNSDGELSNIGEHAYKFPSKDIEKGDYIFLFTKIRPNNALTESEKEGGNPVSHYFYWGRDTTVWNIDGDVCTLLRAFTSKAV